MSDQSLKDLDIDLIDRNPENPRIIFRPKEMSSLLESIRKHGVQVPISVYKEGRRYVLIDGERRWRCSIKLNRKTIPAIVQPAPDKLTNLLLMFNIHALREQWDLFTISSKLPRVIQLLTQRLERAPTERQISEETGLNAAVIRRCKLLIELPQVHKDIVLKELQKPKAQQKLTEDFYIEMERALRTVELNMPAVIEKFGKEQIRGTLIDKYKTGVIKNRVDFRQIAKIARAERVSADTKKASSALGKLFSKNSVSIEDAYSESVGVAYQERDVLTAVSSLTNQLQGISAEDVDARMRKAFRSLRGELDRLGAK